ncbi:hypothetical protein BG011_006678 [Mortierella polycephala]|uniref:Uncharacterized protein n=1 Tax=Mortierella polycephala TaxID=41804 RepID=A0A9P6PSY6_9FUNG|nr:hypothetical protein BG011_006678 [Mortierella polycephala]
MEEVISNSVNGVHPSVDAHKKRKSHPSPMLGVAETPSVASPEVKRAKTAEFSENGVAHKNTEVTQVEFNDVLAAILHVVQGLDKHKIMSTVAISVVNGEKAEHSMQTIRTKLREAQYSSIVVFKDDISKICQQAIINNAREPEKQEHAQKLLQLASDLISDKLHYTIRSHGKKVRAREESQSSTPARDYEKVALFQRAPEGFVFTSVAVVKDESLDQDLTKCVIVPTASAPTPPKLQEINSKLRPIQSMSERTKKKSTGGKL